MFCIADCTNHTSDRCVVAYVAYPKIHRASRPSVTVVTRGGDGVLGSDFTEFFGWGLGLNKDFSIAKYHRGPRYGEYTLDNTNRVCVTGRCGVLNTSQAV